MCSTGRRQAVSPPSANDAPISFSMLRRDGSSQHLCRFGRKFAIQPFLELGSLVELVQAAPVLLTGQLFCDLDHR